MKINIPNFLTLFRILLIPLFVLIFYLPFKGHHLASALIFAIAALTDWLDGYLARKLNQVSPFGEFLDPVADKLVVAVALVLLVQAYHTVWLAIPAAVIVGREIVISGLREWMSELGKRQKVMVKGMGKLKTFAQMAAILLLLSQDALKISYFHYLGYALIYIAAALTLWSMALYLRVAWEELKNTT